MPNDKAELRGLANIELVQALDALAHADGIARTDYVNRVLDEHVREVCHKQILVARMLRGNAYLTDSSGVDKS